MLRADSLAGRIITAFARTSPAFRPTGDRKPGRSWWRAWTRTTPAFAPSWPPMWPGALMFGVDLTRADLSEASLAYVNLTRANLTGADLVNATLMGATLTDANLVDADLASASLTRANLTEADLTRVDLYRANFVGVVWSEGTLWPTGEWEARLRAASEELPDGRLRVRAEGASDSARIHA
ncbi:pentapeptide repeat-containing protein [Nonomuraea angiospora]|uniref:pentapeptide repeat-containing protein n=1 Tax=Nonomuraea angiospora TaxID=46172 RepID=UPI003414E382